MDDFEWCCIGAIVVLLGVLFGFAIKDALEWPAYREAHHCVATGREDTQIITTLIQTGDVAVPVLTPVTYYEWQCDNGNYWR